MIQGICSRCSHPTPLRAVPKLNCLRCQLGVRMQFTSRWHGWNFYHLMNFLTQFTNKISPAATIFGARADPQVRSCRWSSRGVGQGLKARAGSRELRERRRHDGWLRDAHFVALLL